MIKEFKDFIMKGNVLDLAVAVIIGGAFGKIISSLVEDIITPLILKPSLEAAGVASIEEWAPGGIFLGKFFGCCHFIFGDCICHVFDHQVFQQIK